MLNNKKAKIQSPAIEPIGLASGLSCQHSHHSTIEQPVVLTILYMYCTGDTEC